MIQGKDHVMNLLNQLWTYDLYAVSNHMEGISGGHFTSYFKNLYTTQWYHFDDSANSMVDNAENMVTFAAYILFYQKRQFNDYLCL